MKKNDRTLLSTCPICGYSDTSGDAEALDLDIQDHIRSAHNLDPATVINQDTVKPTASARPVPNEPPLAAPVATVGTGASGVMAPPNLGPENYRGAPGDPNPDAHDPFDNTQADAR